MLRATIFKFNTNMEEKNRLNVVKSTHIKEKNGKNQQDVIIKKNAQEK